MIADQIEALFESKGHELYGEDVTQLQHALQAAHLARVAKATEAQVVAALLHDIGHLVHEIPAYQVNQSVDDLHEELGNAFLKDHFGPEVSEPVRLHVAAKRYLCAVEPSYLGELSEASRQSLEMQGGPMSADEVAAFEQEPYYREAVELRRWDDLAKDSEADVPPIGTYRDAILITARR